MVLTGFPLFGRREYLALTGGVYSIGLNHCLPRGIHYPGCVEGESCRLDYSYIHRVRSFPGNE